MPDRRRMLLWETVLPAFGDLTLNWLLAPSRTALEIELNHLGTDGTYRLTFASVLGYRFQRSSGAKRMGNTLRVLDSDWIPAMQRDGMRAQDLAGAVHYLIAADEGEIEVVTLETPVIEQQG